ncbi:MAG: DUF4250 domain-containing protein [Paramuribaculum sp.]|nr:DUF4250 domain-containing protein [Paramuribaculum sp.]
MENDFTTLPSDPVILLSTVNMKLRDHYDGSLDALCEDMGFDRALFEKYMAGKGWEYNENAKKFW